jgi:uncharacterized protein YjbJ (UPF0337 family)
MSEQDKKKEEGQVSVGGGVRTPSGARPTVQPGTDFMRAANYLSSLGASQTPKFGFPGMIQDRYSREANQVLGAADRWAAGESPWQESWRFWTGQPPKTPASNTDWWKAPQPGTPAPGAAEEPAAMLAGGPGGSRGPDFSAYRNALMGQADELNARIQAMYNALGEQAGENVGRIQDIYGGAQTGVGDIYDSASGNIQQAYGSAQQQAADQMARLGIEAAAPAVANPMALSQAQAVSGLETGRAGGLSALERYGSAASGFGSQMAQVAQQQGTEMNAAILAALQNRLADSLLMEQQGMSGGGGGGTAQDALTAYQQAQLTAGAEGRGLDYARWEYEQGRKLDMDAANLALQISRAEGIPYTEALAQATGIVSGQPVAPAQSSGNWFTNLFK